ncbi:MAG: glycosyltransferase, partial [Clostridium sp.]
MDRVWEEFIFWGVWLIIPLMIDIFSGLFSATVLLFRWFRRDKQRVLDFFPKVTVIIPVYNSASSLRKCIESIAHSEYPIKDIQVLLIDNGSVDNSKEIYYELQHEYYNLRMWWLDSSKGKAKALNKGLYMAEGKYIIN